MHDERHTQETPIPLTGEVADVLRKHLGRGTLSLDDAAILVGVPVDELAQHFDGRRGMRGQRPEPEQMDDLQRRRRSYRGMERDGEHMDAGDAGLHAPERRVAHASGGGSRALWAGGILAGAVVVSGLALLSGIPQSLLFPPRGVSEHKDANATTDASAPAPSAEIPLNGEAAAQPGTPPPDAVAAVEPPVAETPADPATDPAMADPAIADPALAGTAPAPGPDGAVPPDSAVAEAPVPAAPEEVAPATAVSETETAFDPGAPAPAAPPIAAQEPASTGAPLYVSRQTAVRDAPAATSPATLGQLKRGDAVTGSIVAGADGKLSWLKIDGGPAAGGYVAIANVASEPRPAIVQPIGQPRALVQAAALHAGPDEGSATIDTLSPGIMVYAAAEVQGGWIEIQRRAGGVGYVRKEAFQ